MNANSIQVGGGHYKTKYEHWDLVLATGMGYLEGQATKYVVRWRKKNGVEDLRKALHFLNKLYENQHIALSIVHRPHYNVVCDEVGRFVELNSLSWTEASFVRTVATWREGEDLERARTMLFELLDEAGGSLADPDPVPLEEENHYSERSGVTHGSPSQD